jgi:hypothetical protein
MPSRSVPFRASELALPRNSECLGMSAFFRGITETVPSIFRGIFSERNSVPNPRALQSNGLRIANLSSTYITCENWLKWCMFKPIKAALKPLLPYFLQSIAYFEDKPRLIQICVIFKVSNSYLNFLVDCKVSVLLSSSIIDIEYIIPLRL